MSVSCVILNYNDWNTTAGLVNHIKDFGNLDYVIVVDNASTDNSAEKLKDLSGGKVIFL